ncbi:MAG: rRNA maturation RNase YbeY [Acidobacteria bacterium]|nr:rRNA maturation RNase YbeY [Acidobacteriota bacterium]MCZ6726594.1 rRNA maturation RNase YbeY [Acidobacteriota bacterium]
MTARCEIVLQEDADVDGVLLVEIESWLRGVVADLAPAADSFGVRLAGDDEVRQLNARLRGNEAPTDVLSFPGAPTPEGLHLGDVLISLPVARRQAKEAGHGLRREVKELLLHGILHCLGHDHETDDGEMETLELELRQRWVRDD